MLQRLTPIVLIGLGKASRTNVREFSHDPVASPTIGKPELAQPKLPDCFNRQKHVEHIADIQSHARYTLPDRDTAGKSG